MGRECISFSEEKIPEIIKVIRDGLKNCKDKEVKEELEYQCKELEEYWND